MRRVVRFLSLLLAGVLLVELFLWSAEEGRKQQAQAVSVPFVSAPAFAEALSLVLPSASTFALTGLALGTGVFLYYAGKQLYDWAKNRGYLPVSSTDVSEGGTAIFSNILEIYGTSKIVGEFNAYSVSSATLPVCDGGTYVLEGFPVSLCESWCSVAASYGGGLFRIACYNPSYCTSSDNYDVSWESFEFNAGAYCSLSTRDRIEKDIVDGTFVPPAPAIVSTVPLPDVTVQQIPDNAVTYQDADAIDWDGDGTNDTLIFPVPAGVSPSDVTGDVATLLPTLDAMKDATVQNTEKLQDILTTTLTTVEQLKQLNATTASILPALREIQNSTIAVEDSIDKLNDTVSALPNQIAQSISEQITKEAENVTVPDLPSEFVFPTDLDMPSEVDLAEKFSQPVPLPDVQLDVSGTCSFPVVLPWGGSSEINFCQFDEQLESVGVVLENLAKAFFIFWIFW